MHALLFRGKARSARIRVALVSIVLAATFLPTVGGAETDPTPINFTIAFVGDMGSNSNSTAVLNLIKNEFADAVVHNGDYDYDDDPALFESMINTLGTDFPYFASKGNHDDGAWSGYLTRFEARMNRIGIPWTGPLGSMSSFEYMGIRFLLTAPGVDSGDFGGFIRDELAQSTAIWRISSWHKNMRDMQVGGKSDATGWDVYEESRRGGAIVSTAHEHSYSRTHLMSDFSSLSVASTSSILVLEEDDPATSADEGRSFAFVSGLGGRSIRDQELSGNWWASIYTSDQNATYGALFGVFNYEGDASLAYFYFMNIDDEIIDEFWVRSTIANASVTVGGFTFNAGETAFADDAFLVSGFVRSDCVATGGTVAGSVQEALSGSDVIQCVNSTTTEGGVVEVVFADNSIINEPGTDLVIFELSGPQAPGTPDPRERFGVSIFDGVAFSSFIQFDPVATGFNSGPDPTLDIFAVEIDLTSFGISPGALVDRLQLDIFNVNLGTKSADIAALGALNSGLPLPTCGDGILAPNEECDDGNSQDGDCCSSTCQLDPADCNDGIACTVDSCDPATGCAYTFPPACGLADGCCGPACGPGNDPDCAAPPAPRICGIGFELLFLLPPLIWLYRRRQTHSGKGRRLRW